MTGPDRWNRLLPLALGAHQTALAAVGHGDVLGRWPMTGLTFVILCSPEEL